MRCVAIDAEGYVYEVDPQPTSYSECNMVISSGADVVNPLAALTFEDGQQIGLAMLAVWVVAYGVRVLIRMSSSIDEREGEN